MNNFNDLLMQALCDSDTEEEENVCLISNERLKEDSIELDCGHAFNYDSLFKEIIQQKKKNTLEITRLKKKQIKCPYCRYVQNGILPYNEKFEKILNVNWPPKLSLLPNKCIYIFKSGKRKGEICNKKCINNKCNLHNKTKPPTHTCNAILTSGKRKGQCCGAKIKSTLPIMLCGRHLKKNHIIT